MKKYLKYKGVTVNAFGLPVLFSKKKVARKGQAKRRYSDYRHFDLSFGSTAPRDMIIICNFPSNKRSERDWLRYQLKGANYLMIQKNIWIGPSSLPKEFLHYLKSLSLLDKLKMLKLDRPYSESN